MARIERLGSTPLKGMAWLSPEHALLERGGMVGDRRWTPVWAQDLTCLRATDFPEMVRRVVVPGDLPSDQDAVFDGREVEIRYYRTPVRARVHGGALARQLSQETGRDVLLAQVLEPRSLVWGAPVSVLLRSELRGLPSDTDRYRPNIVIDDDDAPLALAIGSRVELGSVVLEVTEELERCRIIDHDPITGRKDRSLLRRLRPGALLAYGCAVLVESEVRVGDPARVLPRL